MFEWNDKLSTGVGSIDAQHRMLFSIGSELVAAMKIGQGKERMAPVLTRLIQYTEVHFAYEERLLQLHGYPGLAAHKKLHDDLTRQVRQFQKEFESGQVAISIRMLSFLDDWLRIHIGETDQGYVGLLTSRAVA